MKRVLFVCAFTLISTSISFAQSVFYYPHVADGILGTGANTTVWKTSIFLTNPAAVGTATASGSITFMKENSANNFGSAGTPFDLTVIDETGATVSSGNTVPFQIAGGQTKKFTTSGNTPYAGGFAIVSSNVPVAGTSIFSQFSPSGRLIGEAGVPAGVAVPSQVIFVDTIGGYNIGVAFANPGTASQVTLSLLNTSAVTVATTTAPIGSSNHKAAFVTELFPGAAPLTGTMQIVSTGPLSAIALRFDPSFSIFTTLPPVTIATMMQPALKWFDDRPWAAPLKSLARLAAALQFHLG